MSDNSFYVLVINPGSTSTKVAVFLNDEECTGSNVSHSEDELCPFAHIVDQFQFRFQLILDFLNKSDYSRLHFDAIVGRGGLLRPIPGGTYAINDRMLNDLRAAERGEHASNLGGLLAHEFAQSDKTPAYIVDPVVVDEMEPVARLSGIPEIERRSIFHALNQRAVALKASKTLNIAYNKVNLIVVHLGGGISVGCHQKGRVIDVNNALDGDGPFSPERAGGLPSGSVVDLCFSGKMTQYEIRKALTGQGGLVRYLKTNDLREVKKRIQQGDVQVKLVYDAMLYQIIKQIGSMAAVLKGQVNAIVLTGGLAHDQDLVSEISNAVDWIAPVIVYPGEEEMRALAEGALRVLKGEEKVKIY